MAVTVANHWIMGSEEIAIECIRDNENPLRAAALAMHTAQILKQRGCIVERFAAAVMKGI